MKHRLSAYQFSLIGIAFLCLFGFLSANAQSGRRPVKTPIPVPTPEPEVKPEEPIQKPAKIKAAHSITLVSEIPLELLHTFGSPNTWYRWIKEKLVNSKDVEIVYGGETNQKKAIEKAKLTDESYVLFVQLSENPFRKPQSGRPNAADGGVRISYFLLSPQTGKPKLQGIAFLDPIVLRSNTNKIRRTVCYPLMTDSDYLLLDASFQVADRILGGLGASNPKQDCKRF